MHVGRNTEGLSCNHCCSGIRVTYSECLFVALGVQHAMGHVPCCHLRPAWLCNIFPLCLINGAIKKYIIEHIICFDSLYKLVRDVYQFKKN